MKYLCYRTIGMFTAAVMTCSAITGCANTAMPFGKQGERVAEVGKPVYLMTVSIRNGIRPAYFPQIRYVLVQDLSKEKTTLLTFDIDKAGTVDGASERKRSDYYIRLPLDPGSYRIVGFEGEMFASPSSKFLMQIQAPLKVSSKGIYYLGHVEAAMQESQSDADVPAGPAIPLLNQTVPGIIKGTWQVQLSDRGAQDIPSFIQRFAPLKGAAIRKSSLPTSPDLKVARTYWSDHRSCYNNPLTVSCH